MRAIVMSLVVAMSLMVLALPYEAAADCGDSSTRCSIRYRVFALHFITRAHSGRRSCSPLC